MASTTTTTITLRVGHHVLAAIDEAAKDAGQDRNTYILGWIPEYHGTAWYDAGARRRAERAHSTGVTQHSPA
jgi:hypothetical protein